MVSVNFLEDHKGKDHAVILTEISTKFDPKDLVILAGAVIDFLAQHPELEGKKLYEIVDYSAEQNSTASGLTSILRQAREKGDPSINPFEDYITRFEAIYTIESAHVIGRFIYDMAANIVKLNPKASKQIKVKSRQEAVDSINAKTNKTVQS
jgi:hypothetical protein